MLFNSYVFIFAFLPITLVVFYAATGLRSGEYRRWWLAAASLYFYGYWDIPFVPLLIGSIAFNYCAGRIIGTLRWTHPSWRTPVLIAAISGNVGLLAYFKYAAFFQNTVNHLIGAPALAESMPIPLGISFFTFTQIAYLADVAYLDRPERDPISYALFVNFFPHLIAGPILHHRETIPQFSFASVVNAEAMHNIVIGITIFSFGLFKKVVLADSVAPFVALAFSGNTSPQLLDAWTGVLAYTLQIYFDFSGYSDMAIGLARMFGVVFPLNFNSPYQATSIIDFWRRWHMTLSRFLRDYVYIPLGGNRSGCGQYLNILITMFIGGLWHGAGWTFIIWGLLHGVYLILNHEWRRLRARSRSSRSASVWGIGVSRGLTFFSVVLAWVFFRADSVSDAGAILSAMIGLHGVGSAGQLVCSSATQDLCWLGIPAAWYWIGGLLAVAFFAPNTQQVMWLWRPTLDNIPDLTMPTKSLSFVPSLKWALAVGLLFAMAIAGLNEHSQFLYYQF